MSGQKGESPEDRLIYGSTFGPNSLANLGNIHFHTTPNTHVQGQNPVRAIPYPQNEEAVDRTELVGRLNELLPASSRDCSAALWGLGGSGKTQIALEYAYRRSRDHGCSVFWVHADSKATFVQDYQTIAVKLGIEKSFQGSDLLVEVRNRIEALPRWVLVLDNADDLTIFGVGPGAASTAGSLFDYVPRGTVLWTSRDEQIVGTLVGPGRGIRVGHMTAVEAEMLLQTVRRQDAGDEADEVAELLRELLQFPLAIYQAGSYMRRTGTLAREYLQLLAQSKERHKALKATAYDRHRRTGTPNSILETWRVSVDRVRRESEMAYRILHTIAFLDNQNIPHEILVAACKLHSRDAVEQPDSFDVIQDITRLKELSLIDVRRTDDRSRRYEMHKLVQEATRYMLDKEMKAVFAGAALDIMVGLFVEPSQATWPQCDKYLAHAVQAGEWTDLHGNKAGAASLFARISAYLGGRGRWNEKEAVDRRTWDLRREVLGEMHVDTLQSMASLALTYHEQGRYSEAESLNFRILHLRRELLGENHLDTISTMSDLAGTFSDQGRNDEAEKILVIVCSRRRKFLGDRHEETLQGMSYLASTYHEQGRYDEAERLKIQVCRLRQEALGEKHMATIFSLSSLAVTYQEQGRYDEAEPIRVKVLKLRREMLGETHPDTVRSMSSLAVTYREQGRYSEAEALAVRVVDIRREFHGEMHPRTIKSKIHLAAIYHAQGHYEKAECMYAETCNILRRLFGTTYPETLLSIDLSTTHRMKGYLPTSARQLASLSGSNNAVLPPSFSFQVYVTYGPTLADTPSLLAQDFVKRVMAVMNNNGQYDYPIRFDFHFLPGKAVNEIIQHYRAEGKAEPDYSKRPDDDYRGVAIALSKESWEREGADLILFDPPAEYLQTTGEERDAILGKGVGANGVLVLYGMSV
ncbi:violaceus kinesin [Grosmannia clavigera kw1407]|uniref:Violaceus kinesin n=1 Tax=Grosmannia clavigera (strain kw1407 / UAMH 11150) TaxID=655863 RepID=F0X7Q9_GROCL|nr:violaceus kinesin [Grosmannia clavigera kw1407]EFX06195.1 violaceus kinesin [Grosmannia clavigera kw1407]